MDRTFLICLVLICLLTLATLNAQSTQTLGQAAPRAAAPQNELAVASPVVGAVDYYGLGKLPKDKIAAALSVKPGDALPASKGDVEERIAAVPNVVEAHLEAVCCDAGKFVLYVGLQERGGPRFDIREEPEGEVKLAPELLREYQAYLDAVARSNTSARDLTRGYALSADPLTREIQLRFPDLAKQHIGELRDVLRNSFDEEQRAAAALLAAYNPQKKEAVDDLQFALRDFDPGVRATAADALVALMVYSRLHPDEKLATEPTWLVEMLNSLSWSDRNHAMKALSLLSEDRDFSLLSLLRERALPSLVEMSRWKTLDHALPAFVLTGRVAGWDDQRIQDAWAKGDRESVITAALATAGKKKAK